MVEHAERLLFQVAHEERAVDFREIGEILHDEIDKLEALASGKAEVTGASAGFRDLDDSTGGFQPGNLIVIAARPAMGKSRSSATSPRTSRSSTRSRSPCSPWRCRRWSCPPLHRLAVADLERPAPQGQRRRKDWPKVVKACNKLESSPLWIDDSSDLGLLELRAKARRLHAQERAAGTRGSGW